MSGIINRVGARSGIISGGGSASAGTVTLAGTTGLDYEEGTWTPNLTAGGTSLSTSTGNDSPEGFYTKIGSLVYLTINLWGLPIGSSSGALKIEDLPFTSAEDAIFNVRQDYYPKAYEPIPVYYLPRSDSKIIVYDTGAGSAWLSDGSVASLLSYYFFGKISGTYKVQ